MPFNATLSMLILNELHSPGGLAESCRPAQERATFECLFQVGTRVDPYLPHRPSAVVSMDE